MMIVTMIIVIDHVDDDEYTDNDEGSDRAKEYLKDDDDGDYISFFNSTRTMEIKCLVIKWKDRHLSNPCY